LGCNVTGNKNKLLSKQNACKNSEKVRQRSTDISERPLHVDLHYLCLNRQAGGLIVLNTYELLK